MRIFLHHELNFILSSLTPLCLIEKHAYLKRQCKLVSPKSRSLVCKIQLLDSPQIIKLTLNPVPSILFKSILRANDFPVLYDPQNEATPIFPETDQSAFNPSGQTSYFVKLLLTFTSQIGSSGTLSGSIECTEKFKSFITLSLKASVTDYLSP